MTKLDENLSDIFDVDPTKPATGEIIEATPNKVTVPIAEIANADDKQMEDDFEQMRQNTKDLILKGKIAIDCALDIVQQSDQPRAIEVFSTLLGQMSRLNQEVMDLHMKRRDIKNARPEDEQGGTTVTNNNAIFVGSTTELNKLLGKITGNSNAS